MIESNVSNAISIAKSNNNLTSKDKAVADKDYEGTPIHLDIPSIGLNLGVINGAYNPSTASWTLTPNKAQFATVTHLLNNRGGLSLIYGHDTGSVFSKTSQLKTGDIIEIQTDTHLTFTYEYKDSFVVLPSDTRVLDYVGPPRLSLLTCTGRWYQDRKIMNFDLIAIRTTS